MYILPNWLTNDLLIHRDTFAPFMSDHLPMTAMALCHRGIHQEIIEHWATKYREKLSPLTGEMKISSLDAATGDRGSYRGLLRFFDAELLEHDAYSTVRRYLPRVISGWVDDAFHPIIRLSYGLRFGCISEISAGLAYMTCLGPQLALERLASTSREAADIKWPESVPLSGRRFADKAKSVLAQSKQPSVSLVPDNAEAYAHDALDIMNSSHDFFALHLVTATQAFLWATEGVEGIPEGLLAAGLINGYLAAGAPAFERNTATAAFATDFEHQVKIWFSCDELARVYGSERFAGAADVFLKSFPDTGSV